MLNLIIWIQVKLKKLLKIMMEELPELCRTISHKYYIWYKTVCINYYGVCSGNPGRSSFPSHPDAPGFPGPPGSP